MIYLIPFGAMVGATGGALFQYGYNQYTLFLFKLAGYPNKTFSREQLIEDIWGFDYEGDERTVDVHIKRLRERFPEKDYPFAIHTVRGLGYRFVVTG